MDNLKMWIAIMKSVFVGIGVWIVLILMNTRSGEPGLNTIKMVLDVVLAAGGLFVGFWLRFISVCFLEESKSIVFFITDMCYTKKRTSNRIENVRLIDRRTNSEIERISTNNFQILLTVV